jgi:hypothetical protein
MSTFIQRASPRKTVQIPIKYHLAESNQFSSTRTLNYSVDGLCFETDQKVELGAELCVVMENYAPGQSGPESCRSYMTRVRWIRPLSAHRNERFVAGTQIMARSHKILSAGADKVCNVCDLCGDLVKECRLHCTDENAQLCESCYHQYQDIPEGKARECIARFLVGNVV